MIKNNESQDNRCTLPFSYTSEINLYDGTASTCCKTPKVPLDPTKGALTPQLIELRKSIIKNERNDQCSSCWKIDDAGGPSQRKRFSKHFTNEINWDKLDPEQPIRQASITFSNKCQLMCFYCSAEVSSVWQDYQKKNNILNIPIKEYHNDYNIYDIVDVNGLEWLHITGGEPMMEQKCTDFLLSLPFDIKRRIGIVTNLSYGNATMNTLLEIVDKHKNIGISCSLDSIGDNPSRKYHNWELWDRNFRILAEGWEKRRRFYKGQYLHINIVASIVNYKDIQKIIEYVISFRKKGIHISYDISQVALSETGSLAAGTLSDEGIITLTDNDCKYLSDKEKSLLESHNKLITTLEFDPMLKERTDIFLQEYFDI